jgi:hypothetical protein
MALPASVKLAVAAALGVTAGVAAWPRIDALGAFADVRIRRAADPGVWEVRVTPRGGGTVERVHVCAARGPLGVDAPGQAHDLASGRTATFTLRVAQGGAAADCTVRIDLSGSVSTTMDMPIEEKP